jgi:hypothetical protein
VTGCSPAIADASRRSGQLCALTNCSGVSPRNGGCIQRFLGGRGAGHREVAGLSTRQPPPQLHDTLGTPLFGGRAMQRTGSLDSAIGMASARIKLDPRAVEAIARRVVELLEKHGLQNRELVDAAELARRFGIERSWVYSHAIELGAVKLGHGAKPRLRFDPEIAARVLRKVDGKPAADPPARSGKRASQPRGSKGKAELLPIRGPGENLPPSVA